MLYHKAIEPNTFSLLKRLQKIPELDSFYLVGGTALALKYSHRISIDIDLFGEPLDKGLIINVLQKEFGADFHYEYSRNNWAIFCFIKNIKIDIVQYTQPLIAPTESIDGIRLLSSEDIAAMKINAIFGRASKKDFWDIFELLHHFKLEEIIDFHLKKYPKQMLLISIPQALSYFEEADESENPKCLNGYSWEVIKKYIKKSVSDYLK